MGWRDYRGMSDSELEEFLQNFPSHVDYRAAVFEWERRQKERSDREDLARHTETQRLARWAIIAGWVGVGVGLILGLVQFCAGGS